MDTVNQPTFTTPRRAITPGTLFLFVGLFAVIAVVGLQLVRRSAGPVTRGPAPDFAIQSYRDGSTFRLSEQRGKFVVVNFWGSWCPGCRDEAPELQEVWERYRDDGVIVVGIGYNDVESAARGFLAEYGITFPTGNDTGLRTTAAYGVTGAPETYIVGPNGDVVAFVIGQFERGWLDATLQRLLAEEQTS